MAGENRKRTKGRQKIEMKKIEKIEDKLVAFSKRRSGIYKKVNELVTLTGAEIAFMVYSPAGKPYAFANPSMEAIANRFLDRQGEPRDDSHFLVETHRLIKIEEMTKQHNELLQKLEVEKDIECELKQKMKGVDEKGWWDTPVEKQNLQQLQEIEANLKKLQMELIKNLQERSSDGVHASHSSFADQAPVPTAVEVQPQPFIDHQPRTHMFDPFSFGQSLGEMNVDGVLVDQAPISSEVEVEAQPQPFIDQPLPTMFNPFDFDPDLAPKYI